MPDVSKYTDQNEWMDACMHQVKTVEGKSQDKAVAQCLAIFRNKGKKKKKCASEYVRKIAAELKESMPYIKLEEGAGIKEHDLLFEGLSSKDKRKVVDDLEKGEKITLLDGEVIELSNLDYISQLGWDSTKKGIIDVLNKLVKIEPPKVTYLYDDKAHKYERAD